MKVYNNANSCNMGDMPSLRSFMLIGSRNNAGAGMSMQVSYVPAGSEQPIHEHEPEQCYYIISGEGFMTIGEESGPVKTGDAVYIPSNVRHGIKNVGARTLEYLTANAPAFGVEYENRLWPAP